MIDRTLIACLVSLVPVVGSAQLSGDEILKNLEANFPGVQDYTVTLDIAPDIERLNVPPMNVRMYYKQPDKFHFESDNFGLVPKEGLAFNPARLLKRFSIESVVEDTVEGGKQLRLLLRPREERARTTLVVLYVDPANWKPTKIVSSLFDGRTMTATFQYEEQAGHLMPSLLSVQFASATNDTTDQNPGAEEMAPVQRPQVPRRGSITIRYSNYKINTGLPDDIFNKK